MEIVSNPVHKIIAVSAGKDQTLARLKSGEVLGWGGAGSGRITSQYIDVCRSITDTDAKPTYITNPARYTHISAGYGVSLGVSEQKQAFIWGFCQAGVGGNDRFSEEPAAIKGIPEASKVVAGQFLYGAIDDEAKVYSWGFSTDGALGRESTQINSPPGLVALPPIKDMAIGDNFMLTLSVDGELHAWGSNSAGQLCSAHLNRVATPQRIALTSRVKAIAAGSTHVLAITTEGKVFGWGSNQFGQIHLDKKHKTPFRKFITEPTQIQFPEEIVAVAAGAHYSVALSITGKIYTWGWNGYGQLGQGDLEPRGIPTPISNLSGISALSAGESHVIALKNSEILGWGCNDSGQLGKAAGRQTKPIAFWSIT
jgi:alpha-tubulin suppressor-like RCC1 family protein